MDTQDGDYLVVEIGARAFNASTSSMGFSCRLQDGATVADLPEDETTTDDLCPWIEFSQDLLFQDKVQIYHALAQVEYTIPPDFQVYQVLAQVEYEVGHYTYNGNIPVALSPSGVVQITAPEYVRDGQVTLNLGVESEVEGTLGIEVEGDVQLSLAFEFTVDFYPGIPIQEDLTGEVTISMGLSSEVALITPAMLDLDGGVGIGEDFRFDIVGPEILAIDFAGGLAAGGTLEFDIPEIVTYDHALSGGVQVGGEPSFTFFDPTTLVPPELALSGGVAVGGTNDFETIGWDELVYEYALSGGAVVGEIRLPPIETTAPEESEPEILSLIMKGGVAVSSSLNFDQDEPEIYEFTPRSGGVRVGGGMIFSTFIPPSFALELAGGVSIGGTVNDAEELVETWALAGFAFSPSMYSGFQFNSYCAYRDQAFAAGEDGIYLLEGETTLGKTSTPA